MHEEIILAGFGGQGVLFAGQLLAYTALAEDRFVTWIPSYGPEMRGGTANCTVVISDEPIGSPVSQYPSVAVVFNNPSMEKYEPLVKAGGLLVINESLVLHPSARTDIAIVTIPATSIATDLGETKVANIVLLGALLAQKPLVGIESVQAVLVDKLGESKARLRDLNMQALERGLALGQIQHSLA